MTDKRVLDRSELTEELMARVDDFTKIGEVFSFVESSLMLQNDMSRPVYVFEVEPDISKEDVKYINDAMSQVGVSCVLMPKKMIGYVGEVNSSSMGVRNVQAEIIGLREGAFDGLEDGDEPGRVEGSTRDGDAV